MADHTPSRHEKSLGLLTTKFVSLLQEAKDGVLDLKVVSVLTEFGGHMLCFYGTVHGHLFDFPLFILTDQSAGRSEKTIEICH